MIWIATLCLLAIAAWLFFNALNELRWVQAHSHDETVASDEGLLPNFTAMTRSGSAAIGGLISIDQENTRVANAISKVQEKTSNYGGKIKAAGSKISQSASESGKMTEGSAMLGKAVAKVQEKTSDYSEKLKTAGSKLAHSEYSEKLKTAGSKLAHTNYGEKLKSAGSKLTQGDGSKLAEGKAILGQASQNAARKSSEIGQRVVSKAKSKAQAYSKAHGATEEGGVIGKMVGKVSGGLEKLEKKVDAKLARNRAMEEEGSSSDDLISRVSDKVGEQINDVDEKIVNEGAPASRKLDA